MCRRCGGEGREARHASGDACAATHQRRELGGVESTEHTFVPQIWLNERGAVQAGSMAEQEGREAAEAQRTLARGHGGRARWAHAPHKM